MAHAYTPGLRVTEETLIEKVRRLPLLGEVLVKKGDIVKPDTVVARTELPGEPHTVNVANILGVEPEDIEHFMVKKQGDTVKPGEAIARYRAFFGLINRPAPSKVAGVIELVSLVTGQVTIREPNIPVEIDAYIRGTVKEVLPREGVIVECKGAFIQGIFGVGGERTGIIKFVAESPESVLDAADIKPEHRGLIVVGGALVTGAALKKAAEYGLAGVVAGGIIDKDLVEFLGYDIGVAITGHEDINTTLIVTEGFGKITMAHKTYDLLKELDGELVSLNGATQIRAGVMRPELIAPEHKARHAGEAAAVVSEGLVAGTPIRIIREPYFGMLADVVDLPPELQIIETEAKVRILRAKLVRTGEVVTIPRANVEIIEG
ncbi:MAG: hypothetical protein Q8P31_03280 [Bacillota bacterium]|nr:hypothetical protein [Bacillota bacterium]